jgi:hypothetical protein
MRHPPDMARQCARLGTHPCTRLGDNRDSERAVAAYRSEPHHHAAIVRANGVATRRGESIPRLRRSANLNVAPSLVAASMPHTLRNLRRHLAPTRKTFRPRPRRCRRTPQSYLHVGSMLRRTRNEQNRAAPPSSLASSPPDLTAWSRWADAARTTRLPRQFLPLF